MGNGVAFRYQLSVATSVLAPRGRIVIQAKRRVVERSIAWASNSRRLAKEYGLNATHANGWLYVATIHRLARLSTNHLWQGLTSGRHRYCHRRNQFTYGNLHHERYMDLLSTTSPTASTTRSRPMYMVEQNKVFHLMATLTARVASAKAQARAATYTAFLKRYCPPGGRPEQEHPKNRPPYCVEGGFYVR